MTISLLNDQIHRRQRMHTCKMIISSCSERREMLCHQHVSDHINDNFQLLYSFWQFHLWSFVIIVCSKVCFGRIYQRYNSVQQRICTLIWYSVHSARHARYCDNKKKIVFCLLTRVRDNRNNNAWCLCFTCVGTEEALAILPKTVRLMPVIIAGLCKQSL
jgi:hypothetical protein